MRRLAAFFLIAFGIFTSAVHASEPVSVELVNGGYSGSTGTALLGLRLRMDDGWHTYWKTPGEGGFPPMIDTSRNLNIDKFETLWPAPQRIYTPIPDQVTYETNGYRGEVLLPVTVSVANPRDRAEVNLSVRVFACETVCSAFERELHAVIEPGFVSVGDQKEIAAWLRKVPRQSHAGIEVSAVKPIADGFVVDVNSEKVLNDPWIHIGNVDNQPYSVTRNADGGRSVSFDVKPIKGSFSKEGKLEVVVVSGDIAATAEIDVPAPAPQSIGVSLLLTALMGGLILNLMPCVFPVLSLKLLSLTRGDPKEARLGFAGSSIGIILSFVLIGAALSGLKLTGAEIGWGIQFQSVTFLSTMAVVILIFALATSGVFEISLPGRASTALTKLTVGKGMLPSIGQGFVATLLATPCSAPFVGTAVGFALSGTVSDTLAIFATMGVGMAIPYALVAAIPGLSRIMPRPGVWMERVRGLISLALFATAGWLVSTIATMSGNLHAGILATMMIAALIYVSMRAHKSFTTLAVVAFCASTIISHIPQSDGNGVAWRKFEPALVTSEVASGKTVVVYMTAQWCLTCKVNERTTWSDTEVIAKMNSGIVAMKGDWTRPDPEISRFLKDNGRFGIPFTIVYSPDFPSGRVLPEILTPGIVEAALGTSDTPPKVLN